MPKKFLKQLLPDTKTICQNKKLSLLGKLLQDPNIFHLNRRSVSGAVSVGLFIAVIPFPVQTILAAFGAIIFRVNLPISMSLVWVTNPLTIPPIFYFAYKIGRWSLQMPANQPLELELSLDWVTGNLGTVWEPFLLGCLILGLVSAVLGNLIIRAVWRLYVNKKWRLRRQQRNSKEQ